MYEGENCLGDFLGEKIKVGLHFGHLLTDFFQTGATIGIGKLYT